MGFTQEAGGAARTKFFPAGLNAAAKPCDGCKSAAALLFCRHHSAFTCIACDSKLHGDGVKHERVWMCEVCEQAPAVVTCKADAAALCAACDRDIHAANPLAGRHDRVPAAPFYDSVETAGVKSAAADGHCDLFAAPAAAAAAGNWVSMSAIITPKIAQPETHDLKAIEFLFEDSDQFLEFDNYQISSQPYSDSVVPVQATVKPLVSAVPETRFEIDFTRSNINSYSSYTPPSLSHSVSSSSMDVGVVPDGSSVSEISYPFARNVSSTVDLGGNQGPQVAALDREARVLRYKEKRKNRKFEKTIRYASRKAYAETRPRIKGRFAKRTDTEADMDRIFGAGPGHYISEARYGVVPSF